LAGDGACSVYPIRPSVCRKHLVVSPAADCAQIGATPVPVTIPMAELILSVAIGQPENGFASLAKSLEAGLKKQPQP
jgi:Fe-S-cluster containining protein